MNANDLQEIVDEIERRKKSKIAVDGEVIHAPMAIMDSWRGVVQDAAEANFFDCTQTDSHKGYIDRMCGRDSGVTDAHAGYVKRLTTGSGEAGWLK